MTTSPGLPYCKFSTRIIYDAASFFAQIINERKEYHNETGGKYLKVFSQIDNETTLDANEPAFDVPCN